MPNLAYKGRSFDCREGETVLEALLRHGQTPPNSCRSGTCQCCMMQCTAGEVPLDAQVGLKESLRRRGFLLACLCRPANDMSLAPAEDQGVQVRATIVGRQLLSRDVVQLEIDPADSIACSAGQFIHLVRNDGLVRPYSIANPPGPNGRLHLHIRLVERGRMSTWAHDPACIGQRVNIRGPFGDCHYLPGDPQQALVLAGAGTGLAPLVGIINDALAQGHRGPISLMHGAVTCEGLYLHENLIALASQHDNLTYLPCVLSGPAPLHAMTGALDEAFRAVHPTLGASRVYLCGDPEIVKTLRKHAFMAGASLKMIHSDSFIVASSPQEPAAVAGNVWKRAG